MEDFKGNSDALKNQQSSQQKKVITQVPVNVTEKKSTKTSSFKSRLLSEDAGSVGQYVVTDVIIPKAQGLIVEAFKYVIDFVFYGKSGANGSGRRSGMGNVSYSNFYRPNTQTPQVPLSAYTKQSTVYQIRDIVFEARGHAEEVILSMQECLNRYGTVTVGDFYDIIGQHGTYTDQKYGWRDLSAATVVRSSGGGFAIDFPKITPIV